MSKPHLILTNNNCDTISTSYRRNKKKYFKYFEKQNLIDCAEVFKRLTLLHKSSSQTRFAFFLLCMEAKKNSLYRHEGSVKNTFLPPTSDSAPQHLCRIYYQV